MEAKFNDQIAILKDKYWNKIHEQKYFKRYNDREWKIKKDFVSQVIMEKEKPLVLDLGCLFGDDCSLVDNQGQYIGLDISKYALLRAKETFPSIACWIRGDCQRLPFSGSKFDAVIASHVLEHLDMQEALQELYRVTGPRGRILVILPHNPKANTPILAASKIFTLLHRAFLVNQSNQKTILESYRGEYQEIVNKFGIKEHRQEFSLEEFTASVKRYFHVISVERWGIPNLFGNWTYSCSFPSKILIFLEKMLTRLNLSTIFNDRYAVIVEKEGGEL